MRAAIDCFGSATCVTLRRACDYFVLIGIPIPYSHAVTQVLSVDCCIPIYFDYRYQSCVVLNGLRFTYYITGVPTKSVIEEINDEQEIV